jgi:hypothetical protein
VLLVTSDAYPAEAKASLSENSISSDASSAENPEIMRQLCQHTYSQMRLLTIASIVAITVHHGHVDIVVEEIGKIRSIVTNDIAGFGEERLLNEV